MGAVQVGLSKSDVKRFVDYYINSVLHDSDARGMRGVERFFDTRKFDSVSQSILNAAESEGAIFAFGNGGSDAHAQHFCHAIKEALPGHKFNALPSPSPHVLQRISGDCDYDCALSKFISANHFGESAVVLFSASGNSRNVLEAAGVAKGFGIRTCSFTGFEGGKLGKITDVSVNSRIIDQQPAEDSNQIIASLLVLYAKLKAKNKLADFENEKDLYINAIKESASRIDVDFLRSLSESIAEKYVNERAVFVYAPEGGQPSITTAHIAHNLQWDALMHVPDPPAITVHSGIFQEQFTGISNDRRGHFAHALQLAISGKKGDMLLLFARDLGSKPAKFAILEALHNGMDVFAVTTPKTSINFQGVNVMVLGDASEALFADACQMLGHVLGRLVRLNLLIALGQVKDGHDVFLIENDLAQLKLKETGNAALEQKYAELEKTWVVQ